MPPESLDETQRRLGLDRPARHARRFSLGGAVPVLAAVALLATVGFAGYGFGQAVLQPTAPAQSACSELAANGTLEDALLLADDVTTELQGDLGGYGFAWTRLAEPAVEAHTVDGVVLHDFDGAELVGQVISNGARSGQYIVEDFDRLMERRGWSSRTTEELPGSWSAVSDDTESTGVDFSIEVFDSEAPGLQSAAPDWLPQSPTGTIFVRIRSSGSGLMTAADRTEYLALVEGGAAGPDCGN